MSLDIPVNYYGGVLVRGLEGPRGPQGSTGPQGRDGAYAGQGNTGPQGPAGATGPQGPTGATGPQGLPGEYAAIGVDGPQGETGAQGAVGATGAQGAVGTTGAAGPQGATGATGPQGVPGVQGLRGLIGPTGPQGATGSQGQIGLIGPQGPIGVNGGTGPQGPASFLSQILTYEATSYSTSPNPGGFKANNSAPLTTTAIKMNVLNVNPASIIPQLQSAGLNTCITMAPPNYSWIVNYVVSGTITYDSNSGLFVIPVTVGSSYAPVTPSWSTSSTLRFEVQRVGDKGAQGLTGAQGPQGVTGATGSQGATGATGPQGLRGVRGIEYKGAWTDSTGYVPFDLVVSDGTAYVCIANSTNHEPPNATYWDVFSVSGSQGPQGVDGALPEGTAYQVFRTLGVQAEGEMGALVASHIPDLSATYPTLAGGNVLTGATTFTPASGGGWRVQKDGATVGPEIETYGTGAGHYPTIDVKRARGTQASPVAIQNGDVIGRYRFLARNGTLFKEVGGTQMVATGAQAVTGDLAFPTRLSLMVSDGAALAEAFRLNSDKSIGVFNTALVTNLNAEMVGGKTLAKLISELGGTVLGGNIVKFRDTGDTLFTINVSETGVTFNGLAVQDLATRLGKAASGNLNGIIFESNDPDTSGKASGAMAVDSATYALYLNGVAGANGADDQYGDAGGDGASVIVSAGAGGNASENTVDSDERIGGNGGTLYLRGGSLGAGQPAGDFDGQPGFVKIGDQNTSSVAIGVVPGSYYVPQGGGFTRAYNGLYMDKGYIGVGLSKWGASAATARLDGNTIARMSGAGTSTGANTTETTAYAVTMPQEVLAAVNAGLWIHVVLMGNTANNLNSKRVALKFGNSTMLTLFDSGLLAMNNEVWILESWIRNYNGSTGIETISKFARGTAHLTQRTQVTSAELDAFCFVHAIIQNGTALASDITLRSARIMYQW